MNIFEAFKEFWPELGLTAGIFMLLLMVLGVRSQKVKAGKSSPEGSPGTPGQKAWHGVRHFLKLTGFGLLAFVLATLTIMVFRTYIALKKDLAPAPSHVEVPPDLSFQVEEVTFPSEDGVQIAGWYVPSRNNATLILLHGYGGNRTGMIWYARQLIAAGYGVLMYDERASGESGGKHRSYGWEDPRDIGGALKFLRKNAGSASGKIGVAGCSMGAQIVLQGAAYYPEIGAVWADGPATVRAQDIPPQHNVLLMLVVAGNYMMDFGSEIALGMEAPSPLIEIIGDIDPRPIMLVGSGRPDPLVGSEGDFIWFIARYAGSNTGVWTIPEAPHCAGPATRPQDYADRMVGFFNTAFETGMERR